MLLDLNVKDTYSAGQEWLKRQLFLDELALPDYPRPLKEMKEVRLTPFQSNVVRYGIGSALFRAVAP